MFKHAVPSSPYEQLAHLHAKYDADISSGQYEPFVYPWSSFGALAVFVYLLIPHHNSRFLKLLRYPVWAFNAYFSVYTILHCRARNSAPAFSIGLISAWSIIWTATILLVHDAQTEFQRIERSEGGVSANFQSSSNKSTENGNAATTKAPNGISPVTTIKDVELATETKKLGSKAGPANRKGMFVWQHFPLTPFIERLDWVADLFCNFRGMGWNWRISGLAPPPLWVQKELQKDTGFPPEDKDTHVGSDGTRRYHTRKEVLWAGLKTFVWGYIQLDALKVIALLDPYMWGVVPVDDTASAPTFLPSLVRTSPVLIKGFRLLVSLFCIKVALQTIFALAPLFFVGVVGTKWLGARAEPWMYPDTYGSFRMVLNKGLAGWWGGWWHQTFRFAFEAPSRRLITSLNLNRRSLPAKALQLLTAFALSGSLHASGSYTQLGHTHPISGPLVFFTSQALGIVVQIVLSTFLDKAGITAKTPRLVRQLTNFAYVHVWFFYTAPLLCDDFARGGLWMMEPVPVSFLRLAGVGDGRFGWWCWGTSEEAGDWFRWHRGRHWWQSGIAF
ncbi:hypothetical protein K490DRAFT_41473 [Saccharata proteae CBS 121410]|uniref:Wax synthase domain-containing protein n=1 Tax=Saccharata proteae CBS 121410 TaxID=1314787 RepID=A0A9P4HTA9_9PEZI|nr:hypothetical protein K490DRAFT_41473 [Saccharata proteae CBS 121410]